MDAASHPSALDQMLEEAAFHLQKRLDSPEVVDICYLALASVLDEFDPVFLATYNPAILQWAGPADEGPEPSVSLKHPVPLTFLLMMCQIAKFNKRKIQVPASRLRKREQPAGRSRPPLQECP